MSYKTCATGAACLFMSAATAHAAGIERSAPSTRVLFEAGRYVEASASLAFPDLEGVSGPGAPTGNLFENFANFGFAYKADLGSRFSYALIFDTPHGVDTDYSGPAPYTGTTATLDSYGLTGVLAFDITDRVKVYAGARAQSMTAEATIPFVGGYTVETDTQYDYGYMAGAAFQIPEYAVRVALTYYSEISHDLGSTEFGALQTVTSVATPQSVNLEFQTGIMADTLLFGSVRWVDWSEFVIAPPNYPLGTLVDYEEDWTTYTLGVGRRFNDTWSGALQGSYEPATDTVLTTLGPVDGRWSVTASATYTDGPLSLTGGLTYVSLGETTNVLDTSFEDGSAIAAGVRIGYSF